MPHVSFCVLILFSDLTHSLSISPNLTFVRVCVLVIAVVYSRTKRNEKTRKHLSLKCMRARISLFLWFHNTAIMDFWFFFGFCDCCNVSVCHLAHTVFECHLVCNPCSIYCILSYPFRADTFFNRLFQASQYDMYCSPSIQWDRKESM